MIVFFSFWPKAGKLAYSWSSLVVILDQIKLSSEGQLNNKRQDSNKGQLVKKISDVFLKIPAEGREVSILILHGRTRNCKGQLDNESQLNNEGQLNNQGQLVKNSSDIFEKSRPKAGKLAYSFGIEESSIVKDS